jgi:hypothetical protein
MPKNCPELFSNLENIKTLKTDFDKSLTDSIKSGDFTIPTKLKKELETKVKELQGKIYPLENLEQENLEKQYNKQVEILTNTGILEALSGGEQGIRIGSKEYPIPTFDSILERLRENSEELDKKASQGFQKLLVVPFGLDLQILIDKYKEVILKHHNNQTLLDSEGNTLPLDTANPVYTWDGYQNEPLVYFPQQFDKDNHQGKTKDQLESWQVMLVEDMIDLPKEGEGKDINGRKQLSANQTPSSYLEQILAQNEQGLTPESWLLLAITYLEEQNKQIDNYQGKDKASYLPGAYFPKSDLLPVADWNRDYQLAHLDGDTAGFSYSNDAVRSSVKI